MLPEKVITKDNKELLELHKRVILNYLIQYYGMKLRSRKKFFVIYDTYINEGNIRQYFNRPVKIFTHALITNTLSSISDYFPKYVHKSRRKPNHR